MRGDAGTWTPVTYVPPVVHTQLVPLHGGSSRCASLGVGAPWGGAGRGGCRARGSWGLCE